MTYTNPEIVELIKCRDDPEYFFQNYCSLDTPNGIIPFILNQQQKFYFKCIKEYRILLIDNKRREGLTTLIAAYFLWNAIFNQDTTSFIGNPSQHGASFYQSIIKGIYERLPLMFKKSTSFNKYGRTGIGIENSNILFDQISISNVRGRAIQLCFLDEFAFVNDNIAKGFWEAVMPTLSASKSSKIIISSGDASFREDSFFSEKYKSFPNIQELTEEEKVFLKLKGVDTSNMPVGVSMHVI